MRFEARSVADDLFFLCSQDVRTLRDNSIPGTVHSINGLSQAFSECVERVASVKVLDEPYAQLFVYNILYIPHPPTLLFCFLFTYVLLEP